MVNDNKIGHSRRGHFITVKHDGNVRLIPFLPCRQILQRKMKINIAGIYICAEYYLILALACYASGIIFLHSIPSNSMKINKDRARLTFCHFCRVFGAEGNNAPKYQVNYTANVFVGRESLVLFDHQFIHT